MVQSNNLYTLDAVDTDLTAPLQVVKALKVATTDTESQRFGEGLQAFGAAIGRAGEIKKAELLKEDIRTAQNAALRNEAMPGGLSNEVIDSYNRTASVVAGNEHLKTATMYYEGDEFKAILNNPQMSSDEKIASITQASSQFLLNGQYALNQSPDIYLTYMEGLDKLKTAAIKSIYNFDKTQQEFTVIQGMQGQIENRIKEGLEITGEYIVNLAESSRKATPWTDPDLAKLTVLSLVLNQPETTSETIANIMKSEFSKGKNGEQGTTFGALAGSRTTLAGQEIYKQITEFTARRRREKEEAKRVETEREDKINDAGIEATDKFIEEGFDHYAPNSIAILNAFMENQGMLKKARISYMKTYEADQANSTQGLNSSDFNNISDQILDDYLTGRTNIREVGEAHNLGGAAIRELQLLDGETKQKVSSYRQEILAAGNTLNRTADAGVLQALQGTNGVGGSAIEKAMAYQAATSDAERKNIILGKGIVKSAYSKKIPTIMDLLNIRERFKEAALAEAKLAVSEERQPDTRSIVNGFKIEIAALVKALEAPPTVKEEPSEDTGGEDIVGDKGDDTKIDKKTKVDVINGEPSVIEKVLKKMADVLSPKKTSEPKSFREQSAEAQMDKPPVTETPTPKEKALTLKNIVGSSSILSLSDRALYFKQNPDARRGSQEWIDEQKKNGKIDQEVAIDEVVSLSSDVATESKVWGFFKDLIGNKSMINDEPIPFSQRTKESSKEEPFDVKEIKPSDVSPKKPSPDTTIDIAPFAPALETFSEDFIGETDTRKGLRPLEAIEPTDIITSKTVPAQSKVTARKVSKITSKPDIKDLINKVAKETGGDPKVLKAILTLESSLGKNIKKSREGARGIAQFMPATARGMVKNYPKIFTSAEKIMTDHEEGIKAASVLIERELLPKFKKY